MRQLNIGDLTPSSKKNYAAGCLGAWLCLGPLQPLAKPTNLLRTARQDCKLET
jgi:hypothetical protein